MSTVKVKRLARPLVMCLTVALMSFLAVPHVTLAGQQRLRVGGDIQAPTKIKDVKPVYPEDAKAAGVQGIVIIEAIIGTDGAVKEAKVIRGVPLLDKAALEAVMQWRYTPTLLNGEPVELVMTVTVTFTLASDPSAAREAALRNRLEAQQTDLAAMLDLAKIYRDSRRLAEAEEMLNRALSQIRLERAGMTGVTTSAVVAGGVPTYVVPIIQVPPAPDRPVRVGGDIKEPKLIHHVAPKFPEGLAASAKEPVVVILEVTVGTDGRVTDAKVLRPESVARVVVEATTDKQGKVQQVKPAPSAAFGAAALEAVKQWQYEPLLLNGAPVRFVIAVTVSFKATE